jgi:PAS domain S-box-containing protein
VSISSLGIAVISVSTLLILLLVIVGAFLDRLVSAQKDLTKEAQNELTRNMRALVESEERLRVVTDNARVGLVIVDQDRRYTYANHAYAELLGLGSAKIVGERLSDVLSGVYEEQVRPRLDRVFAGERVAYELCKPGADGDCHYEVRYEPTAVNGKVSAVVVVVTDITERRRAELASLRLAAIVEFSDDAIIGKDLNSIITSWNKGAERIFGYSASEMLGASIMRLIPADRRDEENHILGEIRRGKSVEHFETVRQTKDGRLIDVSVTASPVKDASGKSIGVSKVARDITNRKLAERTLHESEEQLRLFVEHAPAALAMFDRGMRYMRTSRRWLADYGLVGRDLRGLSHYQIFPDVPEKWKEIHRRAMKGEVVTQDSDRFERGDGTNLWIRWEVRPWSEIGGKIGGIVIFTEDITERKQAEEKLQKSEEMFSKAFRNSPFAISISTEKDGRFLDVNEAFLDLFAYERRDIIGKTSNDLGLWANPEQRGEMIRNFSDSGRLRGFRYQGKTSKEETLELEMFAEMIDLNGEKCLLATARDVTEAQRLEAQFRQAQKMEAVGLLAGGVAHDFNNHLGVIMGYSDLILDGFPPDDPRCRQVQQIKKAGQRATALTRQLLAFSRKQVFQPKVLDINSLVSDFDKMLRRMLTEEIELVNSLTPGIGKIKADPGQIEQVIMNLVVNSRDAMPNGGKVVVETANLDLDESYCHSHPSAKPGPHVMLAVSDTGTGMDAKTQARIFEPFFTTKEEGKGTGLGLATVYGVVKQSEGHIWVYSELGKGTTFKIYFPRIDGPAHTAEIDRHGVKTLHGSETILVAEDSEPLRELTCALLVSNGYTVLAAENAAQAIEIAERGDRPIHILLTDVIMPGMNGRELAKRLSAGRPDMKVLFMSGYTSDAIVNHGVLEPGIFLIEKPFSQDALMRKVREVLDCRETVPV